VKGEGGGEEKKGACSHRRGHFPPDFPPSRLPLVRSAHVPSRTFLPPFPPFPPSVPPCLPRHPHFPSPSPSALPSQHPPAQPFPIPLLLYYYPLSSPRHPALAITASTIIPRTLGSLVHDDDRLVRSVPERGMKGVGAKPHRPSSPPSLPPSLPPLSPRHRGGRGKRTDEGRADFPFPSSEARNTSKQGTHRVSGDKQRGGEGGGKRQGKAAWARATFRALSPPCPSTIVSFRKPFLVPTNKEHRRQQTAPFLFLDRQTPPPPAGGAQVTRPGLPIPPSLRPPSHKSQGKGKRAWKEEGREGGDSNLRFFFPPIIQTEPLRQGNKEERDTRETTLRTRGRRKGEEGQL